MTKKSLMLAALGTIMVPTIGMAVVSCGKNDPLDPKMKGILNVESFELSKNVTNSSSKIVSNYIMNYTNSFWDDAAQSKPIVKEGVSNITSFNERLVRGQLMTHTADWNDGTMTLTGEAITNGDELYYIGGNVELRYTIISSEVTASGTLTLENVMDKLIKNEDGILIPGMTGRVLNDGKKVEITRKYNIDPEADRFEQAVVFYKFDENNKITTFTKGK